MIKWSELFEMQRELDDRIVAEHNLEDRDLMSARIVAFLVELSEFANEARFFKFWSHNQKPVTVETRHIPGKRVLMETYNPLLEEFVDALHFAIGIGLELGINDYPWPTDNELLRCGSEDLFMLIGSYANGIYGNYYHDEDLTKKEWILMVDALLTFGKKFGLTDEQIVSAYKAKHAENHRRQDSNY